MKMIYSLGIQLKNVMTMPLVCINPRNDFQTRVCYYVEEKMEVNNLGQII